MNILTADEIDSAKIISVELVMENNYKEKVKDDKELVQWIKGRNNPEKKTKQIDDIINIFARLDGYGLNPEIYQNMVRPMFRSIQI